MSMTQQQYDDSIAWTRVAPQPVPTLPEYAQLTGAIGALKPAASVIVSRAVSFPKEGIIAAIQPDKAGHLARVGWSDGNRYLREQQAVELRGIADLRMFCIAVVGALPPTPTNPQGIGPMPFGFTATITLTMNGAPVGTFAAVPTSIEAKCLVDTTAMADGWYMVGATGLPPDWGVLEYPMCVRNGATLSTATMPVVMGSHSTYETGRTAKALVPARFAPTLLPLQPRTYPPFAAVTSMDQLYLENLVPLRPDDVYRPGLLTGGAMTTANRENYFYGDLQGKLPLWALLSGPRGRGNLAMATSIRETARPQPNGKCYGTDPWRTWTMVSDGTITTTSGYEHADAVYANSGQFTYWFGSGVPLLRGDWSAIPQSRWGYHELWDIVTDPDTVPLDNAAAPVNGEQPHLTGVVQFVADTGNDRVCRIEHSKNDRSAPAKITEFITGLLKPWGLEIIGNVLYVTEQTYNLISAYDKHTAALLWSIPFNRPEGLRAMDGMLYVGSLGLKSVSKLNPTTRAAVKFCDVPTDGNSNFVNLAVSDGTALERGAVATMTWSNGQNGWPAFFSASGVRLPIGSIVNLGYKHTKGAPQSSGPSGYGCAVSMGDGRITFSTMQEGLRRLSLALPSDTVPSASAIAGQKKWRDLSLELPYGDAGFGFYGSPLPWGQFGPDVDAFLLAHGHRAP